MSRKTKTTATKEEATPSLVPKLRFPEFRGAWEAKRIETLGYFTGGGTPSKENASYWTGDIPWISSSDLTEDSISQINVTRFITKQAVQESATKMVPAKSILLISRVGVGKLAVSTFSLCTSQDFTNFTPTSADPLFLAYLLKSQKETLLSFNQGTSIKGFTKDNIANLELGIPSPAEQQKIAECLSSVDDLMAAQARKVDALKTHKKGLMQQLFPREGETQPRLRFPEFQNAGEWGRACLENVLDQISNGLSLTQGNEASLYRVTRIETISSGAIDLERVGYVDTTQDISAYKLNVGDILFSNINSVAHIGKSVFVDTDYDLYHGMNLLRLVAKQSKCEPKFLFYLINTNSIRESFRERANKAVNQASINQTELGKTDLAFPSLPEQQRIASCLSSLDALITAESQKHEALKTHKKGLMQQLFPSPEEVAA